MSDSQDVLYFFGNNSPTPPIHKRDISEARIRAFVASVQMGEALNDLGWGRSGTCACTRTLLFCAEVGQVMTLPDAWMARYELSSKRVIPCIDRIY